MRRATSWTASHGRKIAKELGYECPSVTVKGLSEQEKRSQVRALNLSRRQLDQRAKRQIIADELRENPADQIVGLPSLSGSITRRSGAFGRSWSQLAESAS